GGALRHLIGRSFSCGIHTDGVAPQKLRRFYPFVVIFYSSSPLSLYSVAQIPLQIAHNEYTRDAIVVAPFFQLAEVGPVGSLIHKKLVDVLHGIDAEILL